MPSPTSDDAADDAAADASARSRWNSAFAVTRATPAGATRTTSIRSPGSVPKSTPHPARRRAARFSVASARCRRGMVPPGRRRRPAPRGATPRSPAAAISDGPPGSGRTENPRTRTAAPSSGNGRRAPHRKLRARAAQTCPAARCTGGTTTRRPRARAPPPPNAAPSVVTSSTERATRRRGRAPSRSAVDHASPRAARSLPRLPPSSSSPCRLLARSPSGNSWSAHDFCVDRTLIWVTDDDITSAPCTTLSVMTTISDLTARASAASAHTLSPRKMTTRGTPVTPKLVEMSFSSTAVAKRAPPAPPPVAEPVARKRQSAQELEVSRTQERTSRPRPERARQRAHVADTAGRFGRLQELHRARPSSRERVVGWARTKARSLLSPPASPGWWARNSKDFTSWASSTRLACQL